MLLFMIDKIMPKIQFSNPATDIQGFVVRDDYRKEIIVVLRGRWADVTSNIFRSFAILILSHLQSLNDGFSNGYPSYACAIRVPWCQVTL